MIVAELIAKLQELPSHLEVGYIHDGAIRSIVTHVWVSASGIVAISDGDVVYNDEDRPKEAPSEDKEPYWCPH